MKQTGDWTGDPVGPTTSRKVFPMTPVPLRGYGMGAPSERSDCDKSFTQMLEQLDQAWANGDPGALDDARDSMATLKLQPIYQKLL